MVGSSVRIGIDGAQGTGKTSLLRALELHYGSRFQYIEEAARVIAPEFGLTRDGDWASLLANKPALERFFDEEQAWVQLQEDRTERFIIDSSLWLVATYREHFGCRSGVVAAHASRYQLLLYCAPSIPVEEDGFRFAFSRASIAATYQRLIQSYNGACVSLPEGNGRVDVAISAIDCLISGRLVPSPLDG